MGLGKSEKGGKWCRGLGDAVGSQTVTLKVSRHHTKQHSGAWKSDICKSASFMFRPDIYLTILKIALKMSFWCSKNKILAKVCIIWQQQSEVLQKLGYFLKIILWTNTCIKIYSGTAAKYIPVQVQHTVQPITVSTITKGKPLCVKGEKNTE